MNEPILDHDLATKGISLEETPYAGFWIRVGASLIDFLILLPIVFLGTYNSLHIKSIFLMLILAIISVLYKPLLEWEKSATLGKMAVGIKLVDSRMNDISLNQAIKRYFPWIISYLVSTTMNILLFTHPEFPLIDDFMELGVLMEGTPINTINTVYSFIFMILLGSLAFDSKKQGFHDKYADTYCIKVK